MLVHRSLGIHLGLAAVLAVALAVPARAGDLEKYLPPDSEVVVNVNVRQLLDSPLVKKYALDKARDALKGVDMADDILKDLKFDPFNDLHRVVIALPVLRTDTDRGLLIARGKFDRNMFKAKAEEVVKTYGDVLKIHKVPDGTGGHHLVYEVNPEAPMPFFVALAEDNTLLASPGKDYVVDALKKIGKNEKPALKNKDLQALLEKVDDRQTVSVVAVSAALKERAEAVAPYLGGDSEDVAAVLDKITAIGGGLTLGEDIKLEVVASTKNAADAKKFRDSADRSLKLALAGLAALSQGEKNPGIELALDVVKSLKVTLKDRTIVLKGLVGADAIEEALKQDK